MIGIIRLRGPVSLSQQWSNTFKIAKISKPSLITQTSPPPFKSYVTVRASHPNKQRDPAPFTSQEDLSYLWKLGASSVIGAAAIKYGSVIFPAVTKPNIIEALFMILTPCLVAVLLLLNQSRVKK